jgi:uncharacterized protein YjbJ (UPF0337 family)
MSNQTKRIEGTAKELGGKIQKGVGNLIGNEQMEAEGHLNELKGKTVKEGAKAAERVKGTVEEVAGSVKRKVGALLDDTTMEAKGMAEKALGTARKEANR